MARKQQKTATLQGLGAGRFSGRIAGTYWHCSEYRKKSGKKSLRCRKGAAGPGPGKYGRASRDVRAAAGVRAARHVASNVRILKEDALRKSGPKRGRPYKGCRLVKSTKWALCTPKVAERLREKRRKARRKGPPKKKTSSGQGTATAIARRQAMAGYRVTHKVRKRRTTKKRKSSARGKVPAGFKRVSKATAFKKKGGMRKGCMPVKGGFACRKTKRRTTKKRTTKRKKR